MSKLRSLPIELILSVMKFLTDYQSLLSLLQTCHTFSHIFESAQPQILQAILSHLLYLRAVPEALAVR